MHDCGWPSGAMIRIHAYMRFGHICKESGRRWIVCTPRYYSIDAEAGAVPARKGGLLTSCHSVNLALDVIVDELGCKKEKKMKGKISQTKP
jgi:hypothetical protein